METPQAHPPDRHRLIRRCAALAFTFVGLGLASIAAAREMPLVEAGAGVSPLVLPDYRGSDQYRGYVLPFPHIVYRGEKLKIDRQRIRGFIFDTDRVELDFSANAAVPVRSSRNDARRGMPNLLPVWELGPSLRWIAWRSDDKRHDASIRLPVRAALAADGAHADGAGFTFSPTAGVDWREINLLGSPNWNTGFLVSRLYATRAYHQYYYRVEPQYATAARSAFEAPGGAGGWQATATLSKRWNKIWLGAFLRYDSVAGSAFEQSPLVKTRSNVLAGFAVSYIFWESETKVQAPE